MSKSITTKTCERLLELIKRKSSLDDSVVGAAKEIRKMQADSETAQRMDRIEEVLSELSGIDEAMGELLSLSLPSDPDNLEIALQYIEGRMSSSNFPDPISQKAYVRRLDRFKTAIEKTAAGEPVSE